MKSELGFKLIDSVRLLNGVVSSSNCQRKLRTSNRIQFSSDGL